MPAVWSLWVQGAFLRMAVCCACSDMGAGRGMRMRAAEFTHSLAARCPGALAAKNAARTINQKNTPSSPEPDSRNAGSLHLPTVAPDGSLKGGGIHSRSVRVETQNTDPTISVLRRGPIISEPPAVKELHTQRYGQSDSESLVTALGPSGFRVWISSSTCNYLNSMSGNGRSRRLFFGIFPGRCSAAHCIRGETLNTADPTHTKNRSERPQLQLARPVHRDPLSLWQIWIPLRGLATSASCRDL